MAVLSSQGATDGSRALAFSWNNLPSNGEIWQGIATATNSLYQLSFDFGKFSVNQPALVARLSVDIYDGVDFTGSLLLSEVVSDSTDTTSGFYNPFQFNFTALGSETTLRFRDISDSQVPGGGFDAMLDNVAITIVPEPATSAVFLGVGMLALAIARKRNRS